MTCLEISFSRPERDPEVNFKSSFIQQWCGCSLFHNFLIGLPLVFPRSFFFSPFEEHFIALRVCFLFHFLFWREGTLALWQFDSWMKLTITQVIVKKGQDGSGAKRISKCLVPNGCWTSEFFCHAEHVTKIHLTESTAEILLWACSLKWMWNFDSHINDSYGPFLRFQLKTSNLTSIEHMSHVIDFSTHCSKFWGQ